jgi:5-methylcytosine-specific restriction enzyme subunit McrC
MKRILCEEHERIRIVEGDREGEGITSRQLEQVVATWRATSGRAPGRAFEYGPGFVKPTNWVGSVAAEDVALEVVPRGARGLSEADRQRLDHNLGEMLHLALSYEPLSLGASETNPHGSRFERAVEALCELIRRARRRRVLRRYRVREEVARYSRGHLRFPAQALVATRRPGFTACRWVELSEDTPENRFLKAALAHSRGRVGGGLRRQVDEALIALDLAIEPSSPMLEYEHIQFDRLPPEYVEAIELAKSILEGGAVGILSGTLASRSEILFLPDLFQGFVARLVQRFAHDHGLEYNLEMRGRYLSQWQTGPFEGADLVELEPDAELSKPSSAQPIAILDAKWKVLLPSAPSLGVRADDIHQMMAYATRLDCERTVLVYPWLGREMPFPESPVMKAGAAAASVKVMVMCIPLLWNDMEEVVSGFADSLDLLAAS